MSSSAKTYFLEASAASGLSGITDSLAQDSRRRLVFAMTLVLVVFLLYFVLFYSVWAEHATTHGRLHSVLAMLTSLAGVVYFRRPRAAGSVVLWGSLWIVLQCVGMSIIQYSELVPSLKPSSQISWICVFILALPFLLPAQPRVLGAVALLAALADPLGWFLVPYVNPQASNEFHALGSLLLPPFVCALLAWGFSGVFFRMGRQVDKARRLGAYELTERLGEGAMGEVWKAEHRLLARPAAVKLIKAAAATSHASARFEREAQATAALESPHTVELYDFGVSHDARLYYVMELLRGVDLESLVRDHGPLPPSRVVHLLLQACESLGEAHSAGLVHRDVKPANIFLCRKGARVDFLKVLDFGLVKTSYSETESAHETQAGTITGTPSYLSPEAIAGEPPVGPRSDLYALGCVAFFLLVGRPAFDGKTLLVVASDHLHSAPPRPSEFIDLPAALEALVLELLAKDPEDRPASADVVAERLAAIALPPWTQSEAQAWWQQRLPDLAE